MIVSRCCQKAVHVYCGNEGTSFYVCDACHKACDTIDSSIHKGRAQHADVQPGIILETLDVPS